MLSCAFSTEGGRCARVIFITCNASSFPLSFSLENAVERKVAEDRAAFINYADRDRMFNDNIADSYIHILIHKNTHGKHVV